MSLHEKTIQNFIALLENQPDLFSPEERADLLQLEATLPKDVKLLSNALATWCKSRPKISKELFPDAQSQTRLPGKGTSVPQPKPEEYNEIVRNAIHSAFPPSPSQPSTPPAND